jgi:hypothetical protein
LESWRLVILGEKQRLKHLIDLAVAANEIDEELVVATVLEEETVNH